MSHNLISLKFALDCFGLFIQFLFQVRSFASGSSTIYQPVPTQNLRSINCVHESFPTRKESRWGTPFSRKMDSGGRRGSTHTAGIPLIWWGVLYMLVLSKDPPSPFSKKTQHYVTVTVESSVIVGDQWSWISKVYIYPRIFLPRNVSQSN